MEKYNTSSNKIGTPTRKKTTRSLSWAIVLAAVLGGGITSVHATEARENWGHYCARCHGEDGAGNTKMGRKLRLKDLTTQKMQMKLKDDDMLDLIVDGNQDENGKDGMPSFKDKLNPEERHGLVSYIRTLKK